ncbi:MAG: cell division protein ZapA [Gemmatimonadales bacterium]
MTKKTVVNVTIGGEEYSLKSDRPSDYTRSVAAHVDKALRDVQGSGSIVDGRKAAILAALAITDELFEERRVTAEMARRVSGLASDLTRVLPPTKRASQSGSFASFGEDG